MQRTAPLLLSALLAVSTVTAGSDSVESYGLGTAGSGSITPSLWANSTPRPGNSSFALLVERALGGSAGFAFLSGSRVDLNLSGVRLLVGVPSFALPAFTTSGTGPGNGQASVPLPLANDASLLGVRVHTQAFVIDRNGPWIGLSATPGLSVTLRGPGLLLAAGTMAVDLGSGRVTNYDSRRYRSANGLAHRCDASRAIVGGRTSAGAGVVSLYDTRGFPPRFLKQFNTRTNTYPWPVTLNPDRRRLYVVTQGGSGSGPMIETVWGDPRLPNFGTAFPGGHLDPKTIAALRIVFTPSGDAGFVASVFGPPAVVRYDTKPNSRTYHQATGRVSFQGQFVFDVAITPNGRWIFVPKASAGRIAQIAVIDAITLRRVDWDPRASGDQDIGGETASPLTPLGRVITSVIVGPRGRFLYAAVGGSPVNPTRIVKIDIDRTSSSFRKFTVYTTGLGARTMTGSLAISPAGDKLYAGLKTTKIVQEIDTANMRFVRSFRLPLAPGDLAVR